MQTLIQQYEKYNYQKYVFSYAFILVFQSARSQLTKGIWLAGGSGSFYSYTENYSTPGYDQTAKYTNIDVAASVGYFLADKFAAGLRPSFSSYKGEVTSASVGSGGSTNNNKLTIGPFARYYFLRSDKQFNLLTDVSYQFGINKNRGGLNDKGKYNVLSIMGGTELFFNSSAGIEILLGYATKVVSINNSPNSFENTQKGLQASIGFTLHLEK
jgi:hypothetical protein